MAYTYNFAATLLALPTAKPPLSPILPAYVEIQMETKYVLSTYAKIIIIAIFLSKVYGIHILNR